MGGEDKVRKRQERIERKRRGLLIIVQDRGLVYEGGSPLYSGLEQKIGHLMMGGRGAAGDNITDLYDDVYTQQKYLNKKVLVC